jgi:hypothetical protein
MGSVLHSPTTYHKNTKLPLKSLKGIIMSQTINGLFGTAHEEGDLSANSLQVLTVNDLGQQIQEGFGIAADLFKRNEIVLVTIMPDDSGSIRMSGNSQVVRDGCNVVIDSLLGTKQNKQILMLNRYLNGTVLFPYSPLYQAVRMSSGNYNPNQGTPLYDQTIVLLGTVLAKTQEFVDCNSSVRTITLIVTDGADEHSINHDAADVKSLVTDMLMSERHIIAGMGIDNGSTNFKKVFGEMGILDEWILTPGSTQSEIRAAFNVFSQSAVRASQGAQSFSQTAMGGFTN